VKGNCIGYVLFDDSFQGKRAAWRRMKAVRHRYIYSRPLNTLFMSDTEPMIPIVCETCGTETRVPLSTLEESLRKHNSSRHDGEAVAEVAPEVADELASMVAEDLGLLDE
jgi:hypothetical protein